MDAMTFETFEEQATTDPQIRAFHHEVAEDVARDRGARAPEIVLRLCLRSRELDLDELRLGSGAASEDDVATTIRQTLAASGYLIDPHTACGVHAANVGLAGRVGDETARVVLATAHPAKFPDAMQAITGTRPCLPERLSSLMTDPERYPKIGNDLKEVEAFVESVSRAAGAPA